MENILVTGVFNNGELGDTNMHGINSVNLSFLENNVGKKGKNLPLDVLVVQRLINGCGKKYSGKELLVADGLYGDKTYVQIKLFQKEVLQMSAPDGLVSVGQKTHKALVSHLSPEYKSEQMIFSYINQKNKLDTDLFLNLYYKQFPREASSKQYLKRLLTNLMNDSAITDIRWVAYMLATVRRECGGTWQPIKEWGSGRKHAYGKEVVVNDPATNVVKKNVYYGRGYVQLTWDYNYKKLGIELGLGDDLYINPDKALDHSIAYKIMSVGMRKGLFANASLPQYLSGKKTDYIGARRIINGQDHAVEIAKDAMKFQSLLSASLCKYIYQITDQKKYANYV